MLPCNLPFAEGSGYAEEIGWFLPGCDAGCAQRQRAGWMIDTQRRGWRKMLASARATRPIASLAAALVPLAFADWVKDGLIPDGYRPPLAKACAAAVSIHPRHTSKGYR